MNLCWPSPVAWGMKALLQSRRLYCEPEPEHKLDQTVLDHNLPFGAYANDNQRESECSFNEKLSSALPAQ